VICNLCPQNGHEFLSEKTLNEPPLILAFFCHLCRPSAPGLVDTVNLGKGGYVSINHQKYDAGAHPEGYVEDAYKE